MAGSAQELIPFTLVAQMILEKNGIGGFCRFLTQEHASLLGCIVTFLRVALLACSDQVCPGIFSTARPRDDVINGQVFTRTAVLTFIAVAFEDILPGKINALVGGVDISIKTDNGGHRKRLGDRPQFMAVSRTHQLALFQVDEYEGALH